jgi:predicted dehydrogenase
MTAAGTYALKSGAERVARSAPLRAAIIGAGLMGRWHADAIRRAGGSVVGVADRIPSAARHLARPILGCQTFQDWHELLGESRPDVLHVCTPSESHYDIAVGAIEAGAHLVVEKPLTPGAAETEVLVRLAKEHQIYLCPVHQFAFQKGVFSASTHLAEIGRPIDVRAEFCSAGATTGLDADAVAANILPHPLSIIYRLFEDGLSMCDLSTARPAAGELRVSWLAHEVSFAISISMHGRPTRSELIVTGTQGTLRLDLFHGFALQEPGRVSRTRKITHPFELGARILVGATANLIGRIGRWESAYPGLRFLVQAFYDAVRAGGPAPISPEETIAIARVRDRILNARA